MGNSLIKLKARLGCAAFRADLNRVHDLRCPIVGVFIARGGERAAIPLAEAVPRYSLAEELVLEGSGQPLRPNRVGASAARRRQMRCHGPQAQPALARRVSQMARLVHQLPHHGANPAALRAVAHGRVGRVQRVLKPIAGVSEGRQLLRTSPFAMLAFTDEPALQLHCAREYFHRKLKEVPSVKHRGGSFLRNGQGCSKIGYVSGDFCNHAVGLLMPSVLESHDRKRVELYLYDFSPEDGTTLRARILTAFDQLRSIKGLNDDQAASLIAEDRIDVLIDMHGLSQGARPAIFAQRPAPQQGQYLGFIGTTGMPWLDFVVVDRYVFTEELTHYFTEKPLYVDGCFLPLTPSDVPERSFTRADCGLPEDKFVLAAFGNIYKITEPMFALWLKMMRQAEHTVLWILNDNRVACASLKDAAVKAGVHPDRLIFQTRMPYSEFSSRLKMADLFLDAYPYNCGSTARDVVQAGLPMVTLSGRTLVSRMGGSVLTAVGATDGIATSFSEYEAKVLAAIAKGIRKDREPAQSVKLALARDWGRGVSRAIEARWLLA